MAEPDFNITDPHDVHGGHKLQEVRLEDGGGCHRYAINLRGNLVQRLALDFDLQFVSQ